MLHNYTPHELKFYDIKDCCIGAYNKLMLNDGAKPILVLPSEGCVRAETFEKKLGEIDGYPLITMDIGVPYGLPKNIDKKDYYIVSLMAAKAIKQHQPDISGHFLCIAGAVFGENGTAIGCTKLARV